MLGVLIRIAYRGDSNEYPQHMEFLHKTYAVGMWPRWGKSTEYPQHVFMENCRQLSFN